jgi:hypothetical protein
MARYREIWFVVYRSMNALKCLTALMLLVGALMTAGVARAQDVCPNGILPLSGPTPLVIDKECHVGNGNYGYDVINIIAGGSLIFDDDGQINFWARSIIIENGGKLIAGSPTAPFGSKGGSLVINLWGSDQGVSGLGAFCASPPGNNSRVGQCGIPNNIWDSNGASKVSLPGTCGGGCEDYFYQYQPLPFDDRKIPGDPRRFPSVGYFGYKVLAVSYGGTLQLFGKKGATYASLGPKDSGRSWTRLDGTILPGATSLKVAADPAGIADWHEGDLIVVTTTDYVPNHSEELMICSISGNTITFTADLDAWAGRCGSIKGVQWTHNGTKYPLDRLPGRLNIAKKAAETRAAVALLTRSIQIRSGGDGMYGEFPGCTKDSCPRKYYFGGHVIARQGFAAFQIQGVEFKKLGQGGKLGHYPIHFHMARKTPDGTFVRDSSINESMTRWITVHGTQSVEFSRNVGYRSIGHGFYLEDGVETDNKFYSNLGIFARAAVDNDDNPSKVPGILASPDPTPGGPSVKYGGDKDTPSVFWITNGWNDFQGNMAAGAGLCGSCYWQVPASISGHSRHQKWASYAAEQRCPDQKPSSDNPDPLQICDRTGTSPLMNFDGNYCTSAMMSFNTVGHLQPCPGVGTSVLPIQNPYAPKSTAWRPPDCGAGTSVPVCADDYYPKVDGGKLKQATLCPPGECDDAAPKPVDLCQETNQTNCLPTVINDYTTSFNWAQYNFSAIWLRERWHLVSNSFISDVQNAGLTFISGGDYTHSSAIKGLWELALKTVFVGQTQKDSDAPFASSTLNWLRCDNPAPQQLYCISKNNSFTLGSFTGFAVSQHMFNIYDGPGDQDSNAYLDIKKYDLGQNSANSVYKYVPGIPKAVQADPTDPNKAVPVGACYIQNAAIGWKQPNGFYYPPTFHSRNLFFDNVDIRHYVIVPQFEANTYVTDKKQVGIRYCAPPPDFSFDTFKGFSALDRQTILTDDDGSLTGYQNTISINTDDFFRAPIEGIECQSDGAVPEGGTARTSPYGMVTTVVYPDDAQFAQSPGAFGRVCWKDPNPDRDKGPHPDPNWDSECSNQGCFGVPLYRLYQTGSEKTQGKAAEFIRMAGSNICQRETMTVNHGLYYVDLTASPRTQNAWPGVAPHASRKNIFVGGKKYDFFLVYAKKDTEQTYKMYVGPGLNPGTDIELIRAGVVNAPFKISSGAGNSTTLKTEYDGTILKVTLNLSAFEKDFASAAKDLCVPKTFCDWNGSKCVGKAGFGNLTADERNIACSYAGKDIDCPTGGCVGFRIKLPEGFQANDQTTNSNIPSKLAQCFPKDANWNITPVAAPSSLAGACYQAPMKTDFCQ